MWDEKKFFEDFVKESEEIQPDKDFVERMVLLTDEKKTRKIVPLKKAGKRLTTVAAILIFICIAGAGFLALNNGNSSEISKPQIRAGKKETANNSNQKSGSIEDIFSTNLKDIQSMLKDSTISVTNETGNSITDEERKKICSMLDGAEKADRLPENYENMVFYTLKGDADVTIEIIDDTYLVIDSNNVYLLNNEEY